MNGEALERMISHVEGTPIKRWGNLRTHVAPQEPGSDALERLLTGSVVLLLLLRRLKIGAFVVNGLGTRHGRAWQLALEADLVTAVPKVDTAGSDLGAVAAS